MAYDVKTGVGGLATGAQIGTAILPGIGTAVGAVIGSALGFLSGGGPKHGLGTESRSKHLAAFDRKQLGLPAEEVQARRDAYATKYTSKSGKVCGRAGDPASCLQLLGEYDSVLAFQHGRPADLSADAPIDAVVRSFRAWRSGVVAIAEPPSTAPSTVENSGRDANGVPTDPRQAAGYIDVMARDLGSEPAGDFLPVVLLAVAAYYFWGKL